MTGMLVGKLEFKNLLKVNNMDIAQARLRLYSVTHEEDHTRSKGIC